MIVPPMKTTITRNNIIAWNDNILIGMPELDLDHQALVNGINDLAEALAAGRAEAPAMMDAWLALFHRHTRKEEALLKLLALPVGRVHAAEHLLDHHRFLERANAVRARIADSRPCGGEIANLGDLLLVTELIHVDFDMVGHLRREGLLLPNGALRAAE